MSGRDIVSIASQPSLFPPSLAVDAVWLSCDERLAGSVVEDYRVFLRPHRPFTSLPGGREILRQLGQTGLVLDLGQSNLKIAWHERESLFPRPLDLLPRRTSDTTVEAQRLARRQWVARCLREVLHSEPGGSPSSGTSTVFALPCTVDAAGIPHGSDYVGMTGDSDFVTDSLALGGLPPGPVWVLNDAELAAHAALADPRLAPFRRILVLTLGTYVGAALIDRSAA